MNYQIGSSGKKETMKSSSTKLEEEKDEDLGTRLDGYEMANMILKAEEMNMKGKGKHSIREGATSSLLLHQKLCLRKFTKGREARSQRETTSLPKAIISRTPLGDGLLFTHRHTHTHTSRG